MSLHETRPDPPDPSGPAFPTRDYGPMIAAQRALLADALGRIARRHGKAVRRAARRGPEGFQKWLAGFRLKEQPIVETVVAPAVRAHLALLGSQLDVGGAAHELAVVFLERAQGELDALLEGCRAGKSLEWETEALAAHWELKRAAELADAFMAEELSHAIRIARSGHHTNVCGGSICESRSQKSIDKSAFEA